MTECERGTACKQIKEDDKVTEYINGQQNIKEDDKVTECINGQPNIIEEIKVTECFNGEIKCLDRPSDSSAGLMRSIPSPLQGCHLRCTGAGENVPNVEEEEEVEEINEFHFQYDIISDRQQYIKKVPLIDVDMLTDEKETHCMNDIVNIIETHSEKDDIIHMMLDKEYVDSIEYTTKLKNSDLQTCIACGSASVYPQEDVGYMVCDECGEDNGCIRSNNKDWRAFHKGKARFMQGNDRCNSITSTNMPNAGPKLIIKGIHSESLLAKIHKWSSVTYKNKNMWKIFKYMEEKCKNLIETERLTSQIVKDGFSVYQDVYDYQLFRGDVRKGVIASCILYVVKIMNNDTTEDELAIAFEINGSVILDGYKRLMNILYKENLRSTYIKPSEAVDYIDKFCDILDINSYGQKIIRFIIKNVSEKKLATENNPKTQVTSSIFLVSCIFDKEITDDGKHITKKTIAQLCKISEVTLYKCYTKLLENIENILNIEKLTDKQKTSLDKLRNKRYKRRNKPNKKKT